MERTVESLIARVHHLKTFSSVVMEIERLVSREDASLRDIAAVIEKDPPTAAAVLRLANSSYYGLAQKVGSVTTALSVLGLHTVRGLVGMAAVVRAFAGATFTLVKPELLWLHSLGCAASARVLAGEAGRGMQEEAFMAGLLHDIGLIVLLEAAEEDMVRVKEALASGAFDSQAEAEREAIGFSHAEVGAALASRWHFPEPLVHAIRYHHSAQACEARARKNLPASVDPHRGMLGVFVFIADQLAKAMAMGDTVDPLVSPIPEGLWTLTGIPVEALGRVMEEADELYEDLVDSLVFSA
ncbi:MAG TPA: HDOD domain-containing protein [Deltaproteobacteria bacterium]|nr:HDOD domain-containing protein [Deltaproteobacteria bacterium]HOM28122.1 HDOD domain-containing protein [Deltaproteobacteria bacterium]HPP79570.1 HDOD domain-containing protein [Deltaproteobacteria bacterium]